MSSLLIVKTNSFGQTLVLERGGSAISIDSSATIKVFIVDINKTTQYIVTPPTISNVADGNAWASGQIRILLSKTEINPVPVGRVFIEVQVEDSTAADGNTEHSWFIPATIIGSGSS